jgi:hypothetical protein
MEIQIVLDRLGKHKIARPAQRAGHGVDALFGSLGYSDAERAHGDGL